MEHDVEANSEQLSPTEVNLCSRKYDLHHNPKPNCNDDNRYYFTNLSRYGTRNNYVLHTWILEKWYGTLTYLHKKLLVSLMEHHRFARFSVLVFFQNAEIETPFSRNTHQVYASMPYGALPETFLNIPKGLATDTIRNTYKLFLVFRGYFLATYSRTTQLCKVTTGYIHS